MTSVKFIPYQNRLAKLIRVPGGKRVEEAIAAAEQNLESIRPPCLEAIDEHIAAVAVLSAGAASLEAFDEIYSQSNQIVALGGVFGLPDLSRAAYSLCDLIDRGRDVGGPDPQAIKVHVNSLKLLRLGDAVPPEERRKVLDGLTAVVQRTTVRAAS